MGAQLVQRSRHQDQRCRRRRHHHRHRCWPRLIVTRGHEERYRRCQPHGHASKRHARRLSPPLLRPSRSTARRSTARKDIARVGTVSAGDDEIGKLIADAMEKVTADGVITIEESKTMPRPTPRSSKACSSTAATSPPTWSPTPRRWRPSIDDRLHPDHRQEDLRHSRTSCPLLEQVVQSGTKLLIIAEDVEGDALSTLIVNRLRGSLNCRCRQGSRLRRSPQGDAAGYRHPDRRHCHQQRAGL